MKHSPWLFTAVAVLAVVLAFLSPTPATAVPAFARRYGTSCQTCHVVFPKLTPFGEAFRRNGYVFPDGQDEDYRRLEPQKLGADAYKSVFPWAVWPGDIPPQIPLSLIAAVTATGAPEAITNQGKLNVAGNLGLRATATFGEWFSVWAGATASADATGNTALSLERAFFLLSPGHGPWGNLRVGFIEPGILSFSMHRMLGPTPWMTTAMVGDNAFMLEPAHWGLEWTGVAPGGRGAAALGIVRGTGNQLGPPSDVYGRLAAKWGGMRLDGVSSDGDTKLADPAPWREWSVLVGAFGYAGLANLGNPTSASQDDRVTILGVDLNANLRDANVIMAYTFQRDSRPFLAAPITSADNHQLLAQLDYVVFPWLVPSVRWERHIANGNANDRLSSSLYVLFRANIRTQVQASLERDPLGRMTFSRLQVGLHSGF